MNKNKIIFTILGIILLIVIIAVFAILSMNSGKNKTTTTKSSKNFSIWLINDNSSTFQKVLKDFKEKEPSYKNSTFEVVSFPNYQEYFNSLVGAFLRGEAPDVFVINNNDSSFFEQQIIGINPDIININDLKKDFDPIFYNDLKRTTKIDGKDIDYMVGVPVGYETLALYSNTNDLKGETLTTWSYINEIIQKKRENGNVAIGIGNGSTVQDVADIISQFFVLDGVQDLKQVKGNTLKSSLSTYMGFGSVEEGQNQYNSFFDSQKADDENNIDYFCDGKVSMVLGYPRMLEEMSKKGCSADSFMLHPFPTYTENSGKILANYNYFGVNKNAKNTDLAFSFLKYLFSEEGQMTYLKNFPYYLPARPALIKERQDEKLKSGYDIIYKDFYNSDLELTSFNKGYETIYDKEVVSVLDDEKKYTELFEKLRKKVICLSDKMITGQNLNTSCD